MWVDTWKYNLELAKGVKENILACQPVSLAPDLQMPYIQNIFFFKCRLMDVFIPWLSLCLPPHPLWTSATYAHTDYKMAWIFHNMNLQNLIIWSYLGAPKPWRQWYRSYRGKYSSTWQSIFGHLSPYVHPKSASCSSCAVYSLCRWIILPRFSALFVWCWMFCRGQDGSFPRSDINGWAGQVLVLFLWHIKHRCAGPHVPRGGVTVTLACSFRWMTNSLWWLHGVIFHPVSICQRVRFERVYI